MARDDRNRLVDFRRGLDLRDHLGPTQTARQLLKIFDGGAIPTTVPKVFLGHPVLLDADDTEGASYTASADTSVTIPVVVLGPIVPVADDLVVAHAIGGRWVAGDGGQAPPECEFDCADCSGAGIPNKSLLFSWVGSGGGSGSVTMTPNCVGTWDTGCFDGPVGGGLDRWIFGCLGSSFAVNLTYHRYNTVCGGSSFPHDHSSNYTIGTIYPFTFSAGWSNPITDRPLIDGYSSITISDPDPDRYCCFMTFFIYTDCDNDPFTDTPIAEATVSVWTDSSKSVLIASGADWHVNLRSHAGSIYYEVSHDRYATASATVTVACGQYNINSPRSITLVHDTNYVCVAACSTPIAKTLYATHPTLGPLTLVYNGSGSLGAGWYDSVSYSYPGCFACPSHTVSVTCFLNTSLFYADHWKSN